MCRVSIMPHSKFSDNIYVFVVYPKDHILLADVEYVFGCYIPLVLSGQNVCERKTF